MIEAYSQGLGASQGRRLAIVLMIALVVVCIPHKLISLDSRGLMTSGLAIQIDKLSPAYAALEDIRQLPERLASPQQQKLFSANQDIQLVAGVLPRPAEEEGLLLASLETNGRHGFQDIYKQEKHESLRGMVVRQEEPPMIAKRIENEGPATSVSSSSSVRGYAIAGLSRRHTPIMYDERGQLKPVATRKQSLAQYYSDQDWQLPTVSQKAQELVAEELERRQQEGAQRKIPTSSGNYILVTRSDDETHTNKDSRSSARRVAAEPQRRRSESPVVPADPGWAPREMEQERLRPIVISGRLEMTQGLAYGGADYQLAVYRYFDGLVQEPGKVWLSDGRFEVFVQEPRGYLVAELRGPLGELLGKGEVDMYDLPQPAAHEVQVQNVLLTLKPVPSGLSLKVLSAYSFDDQRILVPDARAYMDAHNLEFGKSEEGSFEGTHLAPHSTYLARIEAEDYLGGLALGVSDQENEVKLFPKSMVKALNQLVLETHQQPDIRNYALIWGRITERGAPVAGARVELSGSDKAQLVYFNELYLPDKDQQTTSSNGLFVYLMVEPGLQFVRAHVRGRTLPAMVVPSEANHVSYVEMQADELRTASLQVYDVIEGRKKSIGATITVLGTEAYLDSEGREDIQYISGNGLMMAEATVGRGYEISRVHLSRQTKEVHIPVVETEWLNRMAARQKLNIQPDAGVVMGRVADADFSVSFDQDIDLSEVVILYFNKDGQFVGTQSGPAGGGFVAFNVPEGLLTLTFVPMGGEQVLTRLLVSEPGVVSMVPAAF